MSLLPTPRKVVLAFAVLWGLALAYAAAAARSLYGDGAWYVLVHLITPHRFNDYDFQRSFASMVSQAPMLFAQRLGIDAASAYAALYSFGAFVIPAAAMLAALYLARTRPVLFAANGAAIVVYGFATNFINTEANLLFGLAWLSVTLLAHPGPAPVLRGVVLPVIAFALLRTYEGMLLVGPILALWAFLLAGRLEGVGERVGVTLAAFLFALGAVIGLGGFLVPRDPSNAASFLGSALRYLGNPQGLLLFAALAAFVAAWTTDRRLRIGGAVASALFGAAYLYALTRLTGYYAFDVYYHNRSFVVLSLPVFVAALFAAWWLRPRWLEAGAWNGCAILVVPLAFAVAGDAYGTRRWSHDLAAFCEALEADGSPADRIARLKRSGVSTAWPWTHPTMSVLLRDRGSDAVIPNAPGEFGWQPFALSATPVIPHRGICQAPLLGAARSDGWGSPMAFTPGRMPSYVAGVSGLSNPEAWGTWSEGARVEIRFVRELPAAFDLTVNVGSAFAGNKGQPVKVTAGGVEQVFAVDSEPYTTTLQFRDVGKASAISFAIPRPQSPQELGMGADARKLGIGFVSLVVRPRPAGK